MATIVPSPKAVTDSFPLRKEPLQEKPISGKDTKAKIAEVSGKAVDELERLEELYKPLEKHVFESWQQVANLPKVDELLEYNKNNETFTDEVFDKLPNSIMRGEIKPRYGRTPHPCIFFKTLIRNPDGTFKRYNIEILRYSSLNNRWEYQTKECGVPITFPVISDHLKHLLKHEPAGEIVKGYIPPEEKLEWMEEDEVIRHVESSPKITKDGKPTVELTE